MGFSRTYFDASGIAPLKGKVFVEAQVALCWREPVKYEARQLKVVSSKDVDNHVVPAENHGNPIFWFLETILSKRSDSLATVFDLVDVYGREIS